MEIFTLGSQDCVPCQDHGAQGTVPIFIFLQKASKEPFGDKSKLWLPYPSVGSGEGFGLTGEILHPTSLPPSSLLLSTPPSIPPSFPSP